MRPSHGAEESAAVPWTGSRLLLTITAGAILLRLVLFLGRGHYVAFDEGWYLVLATNLWSGAGYTLSGLQHVALSPLFPVLAGAVDLIVGDIVWSGRVVAAVTAGLVVMPCWFIFERLGGRRVAIVGSTFVALMPSLAAFVAPYWIGWDLWVGAEPLLHLLLFGGLALFLHAWETHGKRAAALCGLAFGLAYLARPEAVVTFGLLGLLAVAVSVGSASQRSMLGRRVVPMVLCATAFCVTAAPYWHYLHDTLGRWAISGRGIQVTPSARIGGAGSGGGASNVIEEMLWRDESTYVRRLYSLNRAGTALASGYWGVRSATEDGADDTSSAARATAALPAPPPRAAPAREDPTGDDPTGAGGGAGWIGRYARALGVAVPWYLWLFVAVGCAARWTGPRYGDRAAPSSAPPGAAGRRDEAGGDAARPTAPVADPAPGTDDLRGSTLLEALVALPIVATSLLIALLVATDPRTQLFVAPLACFYAARGALLVARGLEAKMGPEVRTSFAQGLVVGSLALVLFATHARRLYLSLAVGSPHHIVAAENAAVGARLRETLPPDATVMSWHPALALFAERDWRVLPLEPMQRIVRYARTQPNAYIVFSVYYPPELLQAEEPHYLVVGVSAETPENQRWRIEVTEPGDVLAFGSLAPAS